MYESVILSTRTASVVKETVKVYALPDGTTYVGTDETEFRRAYVGALVDQGLSADVAISIVKNIKF